MRAVHFGAGNIGRGFIGQVLNEAGYETTFVDIQDDVVAALKEEQRYEVILANESQDRIAVDRVTALHSQHDADAVVEQLASADLITTAVGPNVLPIISEAIAKGLISRAGGTPVNVIACENMVGGSEALRGYVMEHVDSADSQAVEAVAGFPNAAVDRIVPEQNTDGLDVSVEPFHEWVVDASGLKGDKPNIEGVTYVQDLTPYIERKLFTVNTGHSATAYLGYAQTCPTISEAIEDEFVLETVKGVLDETGRLLVEKHGFDEEEHDKYKQKILSRFSNPYISDKVTRVARTPIRKLGREERFVSPALQLIDRGHEPVHLAQTIGAILHYDDPADPESKELREMIENQGERSALSHCAGVGEDHPLVGMVMDRLEET